MRALLIFILILSLGIFCESNQNKIEKKQEKGTEVILNHFEPYKIKGVPSKMVLTENFSIDTEKFGEGELVSIGDLDADIEGNLYIYDNKQKKIAKFDKRGKFLYSFGRHGQGPGEFQFVTNIQVSPTGEVVATDILNSKVSFFRNDGKLNREIKLKFRISNGILLENGNYLFKETKVAEAPKRELEFVLSLYNNEFRKIKELDRIKMFNPKEAKIKGTYYYLSYGTSKDRIFTGSQERGYEIYVYNFSGNLIRKIKKEFKPVSPSEEYKQEFLKIFGSYESIKNKLYFPDTLPPFHYFFTDEEGKLYVMTYERNKNSEFIFDIFTSEGIFIARESLKFSSLTGLIAKFKNNNLYCVEEKGNGFQRLVAYKISWKY